VKLPRRRFLHLAAGVAALPFAPHVARAQAYPARPVRIIVGFTAGGAVDIVARLIGQALSERVDNWDNSAPPPSNRHGPYSASDYRLRWRISE